MSTQRILCAMAALALSVGSTSLAMAQSEEISRSATHYGGCIILSRIAEAPDELYSNSGVVPSDQYKPFTKEIKVYGYTLVGRDDIPDEFMEKVSAGGGKVIAPKMPIPGVGYFTYCKDTEGNSFGIIEEDESVKQA